MVSTPSARNFFYFEKNLSPVFRQEKRWEPKLEFIRVRRERNKLKKKKNWIGIQHGGRKLSGKWEVAVARGTAANSVGCWITEKVEQLSNKIENILIRLSSFWSSDSFQLEAFISHLINRYVPCLRLNNSKMAEDRKFDENFNNVLRD